MKIGNMPNLSTGKAKNQNIFSQIDSNKGFLARHISARQEHSVKITRSQVKGNVNILVK